MRDTDARILQADPDTTTLLACYLNSAMARDANARDTYAAIYGAEWSPLGCGAEVNDGASSFAGTVR